MFEKANKDGIPDNKKDSLRLVHMEIVNTIRTVFSLGPLTKVETSQTKLVDAVKPVPVRLQNYIIIQCEFLARLVLVIVAARMAYFNATAVWAWTPLLVPNSGHVISFHHWSPANWPIHGETLASGAEYCTRASEIGISTKCCYIGITTWLLAVSTGNILTGVFFCDPERRFHAY